MRVPAGWCLALLATVSMTWAAFAPPTERERADALGDLANVSPELRRLLFPDGDFDLIPLPQPGDWLAMHSEAGQTFAEFQASRPNRPEASRKVIYLLPIGEFAQGSAPSLELLADYAAAFFQLEVKVLPAYLPEAMEFDPRVNPQTHQVQVLTRSILTFLKTRLPPDAFCLLGITMRDLYPTPAWNYGFGQASLSERVGVYGFARFDPDFFDEERPKNFRSLMLRRSCNVLVHETGHMFGLRHCIYFDCVMNGSNSLAESDARAVHLCPICLRKLHDGAAFDALKRYERLEQFYERQRWSEPAAWCRRQRLKATSP